MSSLNLIYFNPFNKFNNIYSPEISLSYSNWCFIMVFLFTNLNFFKFKKPAIIIYILSLTNEVEKNTI